MKPLPGPKKSDLEIETNALAVYQVADDLYMHEKYRIDAIGTKTNAPAGTKTNAPVSTKANAPAAPKTNSVTAR
jgi:hypothetical protein